MRKLFLLLLITTLVAACSKEQSRIKGKITGSKGRVLYFEQVNPGRIKKLDSLTLRRSGRFSFTTRVKTPDFYQLRLMQDAVISLLVKPGETISIKGNADDLPSSLSVKGSHDTEILNKLIGYLAETNQKLDSVNRLYLGAVADSTRERWYREYVNILEKHRKYSMTYLLTYTNSLTCVYALYQQLSSGGYVFYKTSDLQFFKIASDSLGKYYPRSKHVIALQQHTRNMLNNYQAQRFMKMADTAETALPEIELEDLNGQVQKLSSLKGKYVLLGFWASWNPDCIAQNVQFKEIYRKFRNRRFEIYQVSFDTSPEAWRKAVHYDELPWIHVIDPTFPRSTVAASYNVQTLPSNYLIDTDNLTILAKDISPSELQNRLSGLLN